MKKLVALIVGLLFIGAVAVVLAIYNLGPIVTQFKLPLEEFVSAKLNREVTFDVVDVEVFPETRLTLSGVSVGDSDDKSVVLESIEAGFELQPLFNKKLVISSLTLVKPSIHFVRSEAGLRLDGEVEAEKSVSERRTVKKSESIEIDLERVSLRAGTVTVRDMVEDVTHRVDQLNLTGGLVFDGVSFKGTSLKADGLLGGSQKLSLSIVEASVTPQLGDVVFTEAVASFGPLSARGSGMANYLARSLSTSVELDPFNVNEVLRLVPPGLLPPEFELRDGSLRAAFSVTATQESPLSVKGEVVAIRLSGLAKDLPFTDLDGALHVLHTEAETLIRTEESFRIKLGPKQEPAEFALTGALLPKPLLTLEFDMADASTDNFAVVINNVVPDIENYALSARTGVKANVVLAGATLGKVDVRADVKDGSLLYEGFPVRGISGLVRIAGASGFEVLNTGELVLRIGPREEALKVQAEVGIRTGRIAAKIVSDSVSSQNIAPLIEKFGVDLEAYGLSAQFKGIGLTVKANGKSTPIVTGKVHLQDGKLSVSDYNVSKIDGELEIDHSARSKTYTLSSARLSGMVREETLSCPFVMTVSGATLNARCREGSAFGGTIDLQASVEGGARSSVRLKGRALQIDAERVMSMAPASVRGKLVGTIGEVSFGVRGLQGTSFAESLRGQGAFRLKDGLLKGINIGKTVLKKVGDLPLVGEISSKRSLRRFMICLVEMTHR